MWGSALANAALFALVLPSVRGFLLSSLELHPSIKLLSDSTITVHHHGNERTSRSHPSLQPIIGDVDSIGRDSVPISLYPHSNARVCTGGMAKRCDCVRF